MKTDRKLKIDNLETELFIEELGKIQGGYTNMTSLAGHEDPDFSDTPSSDYAGMVDEILRKALDGTGHFPPGEATTLALFGEE